MAEKSSFFTSLNGDRKYKSTDFAEYFSSFIGNGVFPNPSTNLQVIANGDMTVTLLPGPAWINGYMYYNTDNLTLTVEHADSALKRIDRVVLRCDFIEREIKAYIKKGVFSTNPTAPNLERGVNAYEISISDILVDNGIISIQQSKITDTRLNTTVCGIVTQTVETIDTTTLFNKLQGYIDERGQDVNGWIDTATQSWESEFRNWFDSIKGVLDEDIATSLANRLLELENIVKNLKLESESVMRPNGNSVENTLKKLETELEGQSLKANELYNRLNRVF